MAAVSSAACCLGELPSTRLALPCVLLRTCKFLPLSCAPFSSPPIARRSSCGAKERSRGVSAFNPQGTAEFPLEDEEVSADVVPAPSPTAGRIDIVVTKDVISRLDLSPAHAVLRKYVHQIGDNTTAPAEHPAELLKQTVGFVLEYERDDLLDPRELSEMPDIRLWFVRLDAAYPWLPVVLDWRAGELSRYAAMLVPHQARNVSKPAVKVNDMLRMLGYTIDEQLYTLIENSPHP